MNLAILAAGPGWLAINKPAGLSVHNDPGQDLLAHVKTTLDQSTELASTCARDLDFSPSAVHRLDRETSGVILIATRKSTAADLARLIETRQIKKIYRAICAGRVPSASGTWEQSLSESATGRTNPAGLSAERKSCITHFRRLRQGEHSTELQIELFTGRQHQIRRHAVLNGHQVIGDTRYGNPKHLQRIENLYGFSRLFLHAEELRFQLRDSSEVVVRAEVPEEFERLLAEPEGK